MLTIVTTLILLWCAHLTAPETPIGRAIFRLLVAAPAARIERITWGQVILVLLMAVVIGGAIWLGRDAAPMLGMAAPDVAAFLSTFEVTTLLDVAAGVMLAATTVRLKSVSSHLWRRPRQRARHVRPRALKGSNDDEDSSCWQIAA